MKKFHLELIIEKLQNLIMNILIFHIEQLNMKTNIFILKIMEVVPELM